MLNTNTSNTSNGMLRKNHTYTLAAWRSQTEPDSSVLATPNPSTSPISQDKVPSSTTVTTARQKIPMVNREKK